MKAKPLPSQQYLQNCFDIRTDGIYWKHRPESHFSKYHKKSWNRKWAGTLVQGRVVGNGYTYVRLQGVSYYLHRLVYKLVTGHEPELVDHINQDRSNNLPCNLRAATHSQNKFNRGKQANNTSGYKGVSYHKQNKNWVAQLHHNGKHIHCGSFNSPELAHQAYLTKASELCNSFACGG